MDWFYDVFGFAEQGMSSIQRNITKDGMFLTCHAKGDKTVQCGRLDVPTLQKLREDAKEFVQKNGLHDHRKEHQRDQKKTELKKAAINDYKSNISDGNEYS